MKFPTVKGLTRKRLLLGGVIALGAAGGGLAVAQVRADVDPASMPAYNGVVAQYDLTPRGDVDGLILADGTEVHFPPHVGRAVQAAIHPGDNVVVHGYKNGPVVVAGSVTGGAGGATIVDQGPPPGGPAALPVGPDPQPMQASGTVKVQLHGPRGDLNGALLSDGTVVHLPPDEASRLVALLQPGQTLVVFGDGVQTDARRSIGARRIGPTGEQLTELSVPPPPPPVGPRGPGGPRGLGGPGAPPLPPGGLQAPGGPGAPPPPPAG